MKFRNDFAKMVEALLDHTGAKVDRKKVKVIDSDHAVQYPLKGKADTVKTISNFFVINGIKFRYLETTGHTWMTSEKCEIGTVILTEDYGTLKIVQELRHDYKGS